VPEALPANLTSDIDAAAKGVLDRLLLPGLTLAIRYGSRPVYIKGYGYANITTSTPAQANTIYEIGSITKQFTAAAIMQLVERGKLGLDDPVSKFLPDYPKPGRSVLIRQLLNHTSGIPNYTDLAATQQVSVDLTRAHTPEEIMTFFKDLPLEFTPGTQWRYSNSGYFLLGVIIERVTGLTYPEYVQRNIFTPLGLASTSYCIPSLPELAQGYQSSADGKLQSVPWVHSSFFYAAGGICSTVGDLIKWQRALAEGRVVSADSYRKMITPATLPDGKPLTYGYGLGVDVQDGRTVISHAGQTPGFSGGLIYYPDNDLAVAVLTNSDQGIRAQDVLEWVITNTLLLTP